MDRDQFVEYIARGLLAEHAYCSRATSTPCWPSPRPRSAPPSPGAARTPRSSSGSPPCGSPPWPIRRLPPAPARRHPARVAAVVSEADRVIEFARAGGRHHGRPANSLGVDGRGWLARAEAEWRRAAGDNDPANWQAVLRRVRPRLRLRGGPVPVAAGRGAGRGRPPRRGRAPVAARRGRRRPARCRASAPGPDRPRSSAGRWPRPAGLGRWFAQRGRPGAGRWPR